MSEIPPGAREYLLPDREKFAADPFGYGASAWHRWSLACELHGFPVDLENTPSSPDLKSPVLWLAHAHAVSEAAAVVLQSQPKFESMPDMVKGVCDSQYCAAGLMLVGYSLETCLKAMLIVRKGVDVYSQEEKSYHHHRLEDLAALVPGLGSKDKAILRALTHFVTWAGRYPDPGSQREGRLDDVFRSTEKHQITARDLFSLAWRVMGHAREVVK